MRFYAQTRPYYCGIDLIRDRMAYAGIQIDHILPSAKGGADDSINLALSCTICNSVKSAWRPESSGKAIDREHQIATAR